MEGDSRPDVGFMILAGKTGRGAGLTGRTLSWKPLSDLDRMAWRHVTEARVAGMIQSIMYDGEPIPTTLGTNTNMIQFQLANLIARRN